MQPTLPRLTSAQRLGALLLAAVALLTVVILLIHSTATVSEVVEQEVPTIMSMPIVTEPDSMSAAKPQKHATRSKSTKVTTDSIKKAPRNRRRATIGRNPSARQNLKPIAAPKPGPSLDDEVPLHDN